VVRDGLNFTSSVVGNGVAQASNITADLIGSFAEKEVSSTAAPNQPSEEKEKLNELLDKANNKENDAEWLP